MMRAALMAALLAGAGAAQADDALLSQVMARLGSYAVVRAQFVQEKTLANPARTLSSAGRMVVSRDEGLIWELDEPIKAALVITPTQIIETDGAGERRAARAGVVQAEMGRLIRSLMSGDIAQLSSTFDLSTRGEAERWTIDLVPKSREFVRYVEGMRLAGGRHLERIEIREASGERTSIRMHHFSVATALDAAERRQFAPP